VNEHFTEGDFIIHVSCGGLSEVYMRAVIFYFWKKCLFLLVTSYTLKK